MSSAAKTTLLTLPDDDRWASSVIRDLLVQARRPGVLSLAGGLPASESLPTEKVQSALGSAMSKYGTRCLQYGLSSGEPELAEILAARSPRPGANVNNLVITSGSQQALDLAARAMAVPDKRPVVAIDDPGYLGAVQIFRANGYELVGIPVDGDGMNVDILAKKLKNGFRPGVLYTNPAFQNPSGACLSNDRAAKLVSLADEYDFLVIADDPYIELYLSGHRPNPIPASSRVAYLGSLSKVISPGMRIGWLDADTVLTDRIVLAKQAADLHTSTMSQLISAEILSDDSWWDAHLKALRENYSQRRQALNKAVTAQLPHATITSSRGGFFLWLTLDRPTDVRQLLTDSLEEGMAFVPGDAFAISPTDSSTIRLSYSNGSPESFDEAIRRLATVYNRL